MEAVVDDGSPERVRVFVSYASEDKDFVKNLTDTLIRYGLDPWWDGYEIQIGDSIREKINDGLRNCGYGVVVLSHDFFAKKWPKTELAALATILQTGKLLPVLRDITPEDVQAYDPLLADVRGESALIGVRAIASLIAKKLAGPTERDADGRTAYRDRQIRVVDLPMNEYSQLENILFEDCLLQGPAVLMPTGAGNIHLDNCIFTDLRMFWIHGEGTPRVGPIGLVNVLFVRCRFKDIGIAVTQGMFDAIVADLVRTRASAQDWDIPDHLK